MWVHVYDDDGQFLCEIRAGKLGRRGATFDRVTVAGELLTTGVQLLQPSIEISGIPAAPDGGGAEG